MKQKNEYYNLKIINYITCTYNYHYHYYSYDFFLITSNIFSATHATTSPHLTLGDV